MKRFLCLLLTLMLFIPCTLADTLTMDTYAIISNTSASYLTLRTGSTDSSTSLGKFYNGTQVRVISYADNTWALVEVGAMTGYLKRSFLQTDYINNAVKATAVTMSVTAKNGAVLRSSPNELSDMTNAVARYAKGAAVTVLGEMSSWYYVQVGGLTGYIARSALTASSSSSSGTSTSNWNNGPVGSHVSAEWTAADPVGATIAYVNNPDPNDRLNLRKTPKTNGESLGKYYNGVHVVVLGTSGDFTQVQIGNLTGYMKTEYLSFTSVKSAMPLLKVSSSGKVNLRLKGTTSSDSLGQFASGTQVTLLGFYGSWAHVIVNGQIGFMMTDYLK